MVRAAKAVSSLGATIFVLALMLNQWGNVPPLLLVLNPFQGLWQNADKSPQQLEFKNPGTVSRAVVFLDKFSIPHVFTNNDYDSYFVQGFVTARDRLWQMEVQSRVAEGSLSEIFGERTIESDRFFLRSGLNDAAYLSYELMVQDPLSRTALEAYTAGVNRYIDSLTYESYPPEYKILNVKPRRWHPEYTAFILKLMDFNLTAKNSDIKLSRVLSKYGREFVTDLFPLFPFNNEPVVPIEATWHHNKKMKVEFVDDKFTLPELGYWPETDKGNGSNNWVVGGEKSKTGYPIIANDTHLSYRLPNLWYEVQLSTDKNSVYGVSIPGTPGVIIGFNRNISWAVTNGYPDTLDWYLMRFKDATYQEYEVDGKWLKTKQKQISIKVRGRKPIVENLVLTQQGPVLYNRNQRPLNSDMAPGLVLKWQAQQGSNELAAFLRMNVSKNFKECKTSLETFHSPPQNFLCADRYGRYGFIQKGLVPRRVPGQGRMVLDGSDSRNFWRESLATQELPQIQNPKQGFLFSANQHPVSETFPQYLGANFSEPYRAIRIKKLLQTQKKFDHRDFIRFQSDAFNAFAEEVLPVMLANLDETTLDDNGKSIFKLLRNWKYYFVASSLNPIIFETWWWELNDAIWTKLIGPREVFAWPDESTTSELLQERREKWIKNVPQLVREAFDRAVSRLIKTYGEDIRQWQWGKVTSTDFEHLTKIPGFSRTLSTGGSRHSLFANRGNHGPVFRMVVELGEKVRGWILIPGGASGNPFSKNYDNFLDVWGKGQTKEVLFWRPEEIKSAPDMVFTNE